MNATATAPEAEKKVAAQAEVDNLFNPEPTPEEVCQTQWSQALSNLNRAVVDVVELKVFNTTKGFIFGIAPSGEICLANLTLFHAGLAREYSVRLKLEKEWEEEASRF